MNDIEDFQFILYLLKTAYFYLRQRKAKRRWWVRPLYRKRNTLGFYETTFKFIKNNDSELFFKATRMNKVQYNFLLILVKDDLKKRSIRKPLSAECRLVLTLLYLSQGVSKNYLAWSFKMGLSTVRQIIIEVCAVLWKVLSPMYMPEVNPCDWKNIAKEFHEKWQMPNCVGCIDGKHVQIQCPPNTGSKFYNYKGHYSIVLLGVCDADYIFTAVDVGAFGTQSDGGVLRESPFGRKLFANDLNLPPHSTLPDSHRECPHYFVGDSAFPQRYNLMRPYPGQLLPIEKEVFNYRLSRARRIIENTFGILVARWRVLRNSVDFHPENADKVILACVVLHNYLKVTDKLYNNNPSVYCPQSFYDSENEDHEIVEGLWRKEVDTAQNALRRCGSNNATKEAFKYRKILTEYFMNEGKVSFQPK